MSSFPAALSFLYTEHEVQRVGWRKKDWRLVTRSLLPVDGLTICRINADGTLWPWTPTEDDLFADDWVFAADGSQILEGAGDSDWTSDFAFAMQEILADRPVAFGPLRIERGTTHGGPCIDLVLPNGDRRLWRPQHQDIWDVQYTGG